MPQKEIRQRGSIIISYWKKNGIRNGYSPCCGSLNKINVDFTFFPRKGKKYPEETDFKHQHYTALTKKGKGFFPCKWPTEGMASDTPDWGFSLTIYKWLLKGQQLTTLH